MYLQFSAWLGGLTLNLLTTTIVAPPSNANKWQMGFNLAFKGLIKQRDIFTFAVGTMFGQLCTGVKGKGKGRYLELFKH